MMPQPRIWKALAIAVALAAIVAFGVTANNYILQAGTTLAMSIVLALAWNLVGGYMGYPSFATAALFGLGAYAGGIWQIVAMIIGIREVHGISTGRAVLAVLWPIAVGVPLYIAFVLFILYMAGQ